MLHFSKLKTAAILAVTMVTCLAAVPSLLPAHAFDRLPSWTQRKVALGIDLAGGERYQFEVDVRTLRRQLMDQLRDNVRRVLRDARMGNTNAIHGNAIEIRLRDPADAPRLLPLLEDLAQPGMAAAGAPKPERLPPDPSGRPGVTASPSAIVPVAMFEIAHLEQGFRLTLTDAVVEERIAQNRRHAIDFFRRRIAEFTPVPARVWPQGVDRIVMESPSPGVLQHITQLAY